MIQGKKTKGRQKIEMKRIEDEDDRLITFSKRKSGIYKKASELATLCGAEVGMAIFSPAGKPFSFGHPSIESIANRYLNRNPPPNGNTLVEAQRRLKIHHLTQQQNDVESKLETEKKREKALKQLTEETGGKGWWDAPIQELDLEDLQKMNDSMEELHKKLHIRLNEMTMAASASSSSYLPMNHGHAQAMNDDLFANDMVKPNIYNLPPPPPPPPSYYGSGFC